MQKKADKLKEDATRLVKEKNEKIKIYEKLKTQDIENINKEKQLIESRINELLKEQKQIELNNIEVQAKIDQINDAKQKMEFVQNAQNEIEQNLKNSQEQKKVANKLKILVIEKQKEMISKYLDKVDIQFSKINKTGEITECCNIQYEGRDYKKLSKSQQIRASLEISNVFNNLSRILFISSLLILSVSIPNFSFKNILFSLLIII